MKPSNKLFKSAIDGINSIIVDTMYVKNLGVTTCLDCRYFVPANQSILHLSKCAKFGEQDLVTGKIELAYARIKRQYGPCGINAKYKKPIGNDEIILICPVDDKVKTP